MGAMPLILIGSGAAVAAPLMAGRPNAVAGQRLNRATATQAAVRFCRAIDASAGRPVDAVFPSTQRHSFLPPPYWQSCWRVRFAQGAEVDVCDASGVITHFFLPSASLGGTHRAAGQAISRPVALARAAAVIAAAHVTEPLAPPQAQEAEMSSPATWEAHVWSVVWARQAHGVPFQGQQVTVLLQAETGAVEGMGVTFPTPPPAPARPSLTAAQATARGRAALTRMAVPGGAALRPVGTPLLAWITSRTHPALPRIQAGRPPAMPVETILPPRLAWECLFRDAGGDTMFVAVDAVTGKALPDGFGLLPAPHRRPHVGL
jgi:hypothetical protein